MHLDILMNILIEMLIYMRLHKILQKKGKIKHHDEIIIAEIFL